MTGHINIYLYCTVQFLNGVKVFKNVVDMTFLCSGVDNYYYYVMFIVLATVVYQDDGLY